jgi:tRNA U34 5-methylaminomethyl-2-thiouridine-forming methyltransferase MnmC
MEEDKLKPEIIESADGSHTLRVDSLNETYHSHKGALTESLHVFLKMGLALFSERDSIHLLEVGFGTGLNALLTAIDSTRNAVHYTSLETYPLSWEMVSKLNYAQLANDHKAESIFEKRPLVRYKILRQSKRLIWCITMRLRHMLNPNFGSQPFGKSFLR